jgi:ATP/maltotriose-dependent transcriptional regulator MalT
VVFGDAIRAIELARNSSQPEQHRFCDELVGTKQLWLQACREAVLAGNAAWLQPYLPMASGQPWPLDLLADEHMQYPAIAQVLAGCAYAAIQLHQFSRGSAAQATVTVLVETLCLSADLWNNLDSPSAIMPPDQALIARICAKPRWIDAPQQQIQSMLMEVKHVKPHLHVAALGDLICSYFLGKEPPLLQRTVAVPVLLDLHDGGLIATLHLESRSSSLGELYPDLQRMAFFRGDTAFQLAVDTAWAYARAQIAGDLVAELPDVRWSLQVDTEARYRSPYLSRIAGGSLGAGYALGLSHLFDADRPMIVQGWAITGAISLDGTMESVGGYDAKLEASRTKKQNVIVPAADLQEITLKGWDRRFANDQLVLVGAATIQEASEIAIRQPSVPEPERPPETRGFLGRVDELDSLSQQLTSDRLVVITGLPGVGKTALAAALAQRHGGFGHLFWHTFHAGDSLHIIIWKLAQFLAWHGRSDLWLQLQSAQQTRGQIQPDEVLCNHLIHTMKGQRFVVCFDDFHIVDDDPHLDHFVERLNRIEDGSIWLIITSRLKPRSKWMYGVVKLPGLDYTGAQALLGAQMLSLDAKLLASLYARTEGNPQLLLLATNAIKRAADPEILISQLPSDETITHFLMTELDRGLREDERAVMSAVAALLDYGGTRDAIEAVMDTQGVPRILYRLCDRYLLTTGDGEAGKEYHQHAMVQAFYYDLLSKRTRRTLHVRAGAYYETKPPDALKAARHFERAGEHARAADIAARDVWAIINQGQARALRHLLEGLTASQVGAPLWVAVLLARGDVLALLGDNELALASYQQALDRLAAEPSSPPVRVRRAHSCRGIGELLQHKSPREALEWLNRGLNELNGASAEEEAALLIKASTVQMNLGEIDAALDSVRQGMALLTDEPSQLRVRSLINLGMIYCARGDLDRGNAFSQRGLEMSLQLHDYWTTVTSWINIGVEIEVAGDWDGAAAHYHKALDLAERLGSTEHQLALELNLGILKTNYGQFEVAEKHLLRCIEMARAGDVNYRLVASQSSLADLYLRQCDPDRAAPLLAAAEQLALEVGAKDQLPEIYRGRAHVCLARGAARDALRFARCSIRLSRQLGSQIGMGMGRRILGIVLLAQQQPEQGLTAFKQSLGLLLNRDPYEAARTKYAWGVSLLSIGDIIGGHTLLQEARATFDSLGAQHDLAAVDAALA